MLKTCLHTLKVEIEDLISHNRTQSELIEDSSNWLRFRSSLDVIADTQLAIEAFKIEELGDSLINGFGYLQIYGLMQSLFLQQDAVKNMAKSLSIDYELTPELKNIRSLRNDAIGHPTDRNNGQYFCFIVRSSIHDGCFTYYKDRPEGDRFNEVRVNIDELIKIQFQNISDALNDVILDLKIREQKHRDRFKGVKMIDAFPSVLNWYFSKINEAISNPKLHKIAVLNVGEIRNILPKLEKELSERGELISGNWYSELAINPAPNNSMILYYNNSKL